MCSYEDLAVEYYDPKRHPTCSNFRDASRTIVIGFVKTWLRLASSAPRWLDVGAGKSVAAEVLQDFRTPSHFLIATDESLEMLRHTPKSAKVGLVLSSAYALPFAPESLDGAIISLGDPFNKIGFWSELNQALAPGSPVCFTTPSFGWCETYRLQEGSPIDIARFSLESGDLVDVESYVYPVEHQIAIFKDAGFEILDVKTVEPNEIPGPLSSKLVATESVITGYELRRP